MLNLSFHDPKDGGIPWKILWLCSFQILQADVTKTSINVGRVHLFPECNKCCRVSALSKPHPHRAPAASTEWASKSQVFNGLFYSAIAQNAAAIIIHVIMSPTEHVLCVNLSANTSHTNTLSFIVHFNRQIQVNASSASTSLK